MTELAHRAKCFGGRVVVHVGGPGAAELASDAIDRLHEIDRRLSRFRPDSELCALNADPRPAVPASPLMLDLVAAIRDAGERTGGLVDGTLLDELECAGYVESMADGGSPLPSEPLPRPSARGPRDAGAGWASLSVDRSRGEVRRPPGVRIDSGGLGKGLAADRVAADLAASPTYCVDCCGDMRIGGAAGLPRSVSIAHPFTGDAACEFAVVGGAVATSGVSERVWIGPDGAPAHHLIDPRTGESARTGVAQASALAPTATEAEALAKAALLAGPDGGTGWLPHGGALVLSDGSVRRVEAPFKTLAA